MKNTIIYLIRHAEQLKENIIPVNINEDNQTKNEKILLSIKGEHDSEKFSKSDIASNINILYSSNYVRAISTAKYISKSLNIPINIDENFNERKLGDLDALNEMGKTKNNNYTTEQLIDIGLKNIDGESREEVSKRFLSSLNHILENNSGKNIAIVSHGAAIKFLLMTWCTLNNKYEIEYNNNIIIKNKLELPNVIKITFKEKDIINIENICTY